MPGEPQRGCYCWGIIKARVRGQVYRKSSNYLLNVLTLQIKEKELQKKIRVERTDHYDRLFWWIAIPLFVYTIATFLFRGNWSSPYSIISVIFLTIGPAYVLCWGVLRKFPQTRVYTLLLPTAVHMLFLVHISFFYLFWLDEAETAPVVIDQTGCIILLLLFHCVNYNSFLQVVLVENGLVFVGHIFVFSALRTRQFSGEIYDRCELVRGDTYIFYEMIRFAFVQAVLTAHKYLI